jgi:hypothetical protein
MPGFVPGIHVLGATKNVDGRDKPGHDEYGTRVSKDEEQKDTWFETPLTRLLTMR